jgi:hypothetical protein
MARIPWIGLAALVGMFVIPHLPSWIFEGPRTVKHWPRRHICGDCGAAWTAGHTCQPADPFPRPLRGDLRRPTRPAGPVRAVEGSPARGEVVRRGADARMS